MVWGDYSVLYKLIYFNTLRLISEIFKKTKSEISFTSIAMKINLSVSNVIRFFDMLAYDTSKELPNVLSIDEFKGIILRNTWLWR